MGKRGFTLIELLVVISIIALLLAILLPALSAVKERAQAVICKTNLKQYSLAMAMYLNGNDDRYPLSHYSVFYAQPGTYADYRCLWHDGGVDYGDVRNQGPLFSYLETMKVHLCPVSRRFARNLGHVDFPNDPTPMEPVYSYSQNHYLGGYGGGDFLGVGKSGQVVSPWDVVLFVEETLWLLPGLASHILNDTCFFTRHPDDPANFEGDCIATYHKTSLSDPDGGVGNTIFIDGHVDYVDPKIKVEYDWGTVNNSYKHAWPKGNIGPDCPY